MPHPSKESEPGHRLSMLLPATVLALSAVVFLSYLRFALESVTHVNDFLIFWSAGRYALQAPLEGVYQSAAFDAFRLTLGDGHVSSLPFLYPPFTAFLFVPLGMLPYERALLVWNAGALLLYLAAAWCFIRPRAIATAAALVAPATVVVLMAGQLGLLTGGLTLFGIRLLGKRPLVAGTLLGLLTLKPQLALLPCLLLLASRQYRACLAAALTVGALGVASGLTFGFDAWTSWIHCLGGFASGLGGSDPHQRYGISAYFTLLSLGLDKHLALAVQSLITLLVLWLVTRTLHRGFTTAQVMLILVGLYLATPYAVVYDMPVISLVCLMLFAEGRSTGFRTGELLLAACAWCLPLILVLPDLRIPALGLAVIGGLFIVLLRRASSGTISQAN